MSEQQERGALFFLVFSSEHCRKLIAEGNSRFAVAFRLERKTRELGTTFRGVNQKVIPLNLVLKTARIYCSLFGDFYNYEQVRSFLQDILLNYAN